MMKIQQSTVANPSPALGFDAFQLCAVAQLSGQTATDSRYQLELLEPHSLRHLSSAAVFYTCELASLPGYCWLLLFSAEAMLGHNVSPRAVTKGCSRRHSCFVAARLCLTVEASGRSLKLACACCLEEDLAWCWLGLGGSGWSECWVLLSSSGLLGVSVGLAEKKSAFWVWGSCGLDRLNEVDSGTGAFWLGWG